MAWFRSKGKPGYLRESASARRLDHVYPGPPKPGEHAFVHTHPFTRVMGTVSTPSLSDLATFFAEHVFDSDVRVWEIATVDKKGKEIGVFAFRAQKKLLDSQTESDRIRFLIERVFINNLDKPTVEKYRIAERLRQYLVKNKFFVEHAVSRRGYEFAYDSSRHVGFFRKKRKKPGEEITKTSSQRR